MDKHLKHKNLISRWLDGRLTDKEKKQLDKTGELNALKIVLDDIDTWKVKEFDLEQGLTNLNERKRLIIGQSKQPKNRIWMRIAATIIILMTTYFSWDYLNNAEIIIATNIAETKDIILPDSSLVKLDAVSTITYRQKRWSKRREMHLAGQAFFDVTSGSTFKVNTSQGLITVIGTQFNVQVDQEHFLVNCFEGKVKVTYDTQEEILEIGDALALENGKLIRSEHTNKVPVWTQGVSKYNQARLRDVVTDLKKYYKIKIQLPDKYANLKFTGAMTHTNLEQALNSIFIPMEIDYILLKSGEIIIK